MNPALISSIMAPNFEIQECVRNMHAVRTQCEILAWDWGVGGGHVKRPLRLLYKVDGSQAAEVTRALSS